MDSLINLLKESTLETLQAFTRIFNACIQLLPLLLMVLIPCIIFSLVLVKFKNFCVKVGKKNGTQGDEENC